MRIDHVAINAVDLDEELAFFTGFIGMKLLQRWDEPRQAYVGFDEGPVVGIIENPSFDNSAHTMAHVALAVAEGDFAAWVEKVRAGGVEVVSGPRPQRGGETILFRTPGGNIVEVCYPPARETITGRVC